MVDVGAESYREAACLESLWLEVLDRIQVRQVDCR